MELTEKQRTHILHQLETRAKQNPVIEVSLSLSPEEYEGLKNEMTILGE